MNRETISEDIRDDGVAFLTLARPAVHNAFNETMISELTSAIGRLGALPEVRAIVLRALGKSFSAGADLDWMRRMAEFGIEENRTDARLLADLMQVLDTVPKPTIARVHGSVFGGGLGLVACCDIAVASETATFCLSEVRLGLIPAVISPYVIAAIGARAARRWFLTAERFDAREAWRLGLVHEVVTEADLDEAIEDLAGWLRQGAPRAQYEAKRLIRDMAGRAVDGAVIADTADRIARRRADPEGREGVAAFLEKRLPAWRE
jgi:methylglutaconyl-CoA hydratase